MGYADDSASDHGIGRRRSRRPGRSGSSALVEHAIPVDLPFWHGVSTGRHPCAAPRRTGVALASAGSAAQRPAVDDDSAAARPCREAAAGAGGGRGHKDPLVRHDAGPSHGDRFGGVERVSPICVRRELVRRASPTGPDHPGSRLFVLVGSPSDRRRNSPRRDRGGRITPADGVPAARSARPHPRGARCRCLAAPPCPGRAR